MSAGRKGNKWVHRWLRTRKPTKVVPSQRKVSTLISKRKQGMSKRAKIRGEKKQADTFAIAVVAPMSAGKSTLLNAMMGCRLLPSRSTACTAGVFTIVDKDGSSGFKVRARRKDGRFTSWVKATTSRLSEINDSGVTEVEIEGDLTRIKNYRNAFRVAFIDTPGPNNSCDSTHADLFRKALASHKYAAIVVLLDASALHTTDEVAMLQDVHRFVLEKKGTASVMFAINKIDAFFRGGEGARSVRDVVRDTQEFLSEKCNFDNPVVVPLWSSLALDCRRLASENGENGFDEDEADDFLLSFKKARNHRRELELALEDSGFKVMCDSVPLAGSQGRKEAMRCGDGEINAADISFVDMLSGVPFVERWAESLMCEYFKNN